MCVCVCVVTCGEDECDHMLSSSESAASQTQTVHTFKKAGLHNEATFVALHGKKCQCFLNLTCGSNCSPQNWGQDPCKGTQDESEGAQDSLVTKCKKLHFNVCFLKIISSEFDLFVSLKTIQ